MYSRILAQNFSISVDDKEGFDIPALWDKSIARVIGVLAGLSFGSSPSYPSRI